MALSKDLRQRIINAYENNEGSIKKLSLRFKVATSTVWELLKLYRSTQQLEATSPPGRTPKVGLKEVRIIERLIRQKNDSTLFELCHAFDKETGIKIGKSTMHRVCSRLKISYKKKRISSGTKSS